MKLFYEIPADAVPGSAADVSIAPEPASSLA